MQSEQALEEREREEDSSARVNPNQIDPQCSIETLFLRDLGRKKYNTNTEERILRTFYPKRVNEKIYLNVLALYLRAVFRKENNKE